MSAIEKTIEPKLNTLEILKDLDIISDGQRISNQKLLLTYKLVYSDEHTDIEACNEIKKANRILDHLKKVAHPYDKLKLKIDHAIANNPLNKWRGIYFLIDFGKAFDKPNKSCFDFEGITPIVRKLKNMIEWNKAAMLLYRLNPENEHLVCYADRIQECSTVNEAMRLFCREPGQASGIKLIFECKKFDYNPICRIEKLRKWQQIIERETNNEVDDRKIVWIYDNIGRKGKTQLIHYLRNKYPEKYISIGSLNHRNMGTVIDGYVTKKKWRGDTILIDLPRSCEKLEIYQALEQLKNAQVSVEKYESKELSLAKQCHIIIFANFLPNANITKESRNSTKISDDRIHTYELLNLTYDEESKDHVDHYENHYSQITKCDLEIGDFNDCEPDEEGTITHIREITKPVFLKIKIYEQALDKEWEDEMEEERKYIEREVNKLLKIRKERREAAKAKEEAQDNEDDKCSISSKSSKINFKFKNKNGLPLKELAKT